MQNERPQPNPTHEGEIVCARGIHDIENGADKFNVSIDTPSK